MRVSRISFPPLFLSSVMLTDVPSLLALVYNISAPYCSALVHYISISNDLYFGNCQSCQRRAHCISMKDTIISFATFTLSDAGARQCERPPPFYSRLNTSTGLGMQSNLQCTKCYTCCTKLLTVCNVNHIVEAFSLGVQLLPVRSFPCLEHSSIQSRLKLSEVLKHMNCGHFYFVIYELS